MTAPSLEQPTAVHALAGKYLTFVLADEAYAFAVLAVHEIVGMLPVTPVPHVDAVVRGVVNLRGRVIPVLDLRRRFGMPASEDPETCIVVLRTGAQLVGVAVDAVTEVRMIRTDELEPPPSFGRDVDLSCLSAIAKLDGRVCMLLDVGRVLALSVGGAGN